MGSGLFVVPLPARAQPPERVYRLGWLSTVATRSEPYNVAFVQRLQELGLTEGRNLAIEFGSANGRAERLPEIAANLAHRKCDVFIAPGNEATLTALERVSRDTPIVVVANDYDPVATGHIASLARPGGRITGVSQLQGELPAKRLELLKELLPRARRIAVLADAGTGGQLTVVNAAAKRLGITVHVIEFRRVPYDYEGAFAEAVRTESEAILPLASAYFVAARHLLPELALRHRLPTIFGHSVWAQAGGLLSYGPNFSDFYRRAADQVAMILRGANPAEMPVEQPTKFELVINLKTAKALQLTIPPSLLQRADQVIE